MSTELKRMSITVQPEWATEIDKLKKELFYNKSMAELIRYLIQKGLEAEASAQKKDDV